MLWTQALRMGGSPKVGGLVNQGSDPEFEEYVSAASSVLQVSVNTPSSASIAE